MQALHDLLLDRAHGRARANPGKKQIIVTQCSNQKFIRLLIQWLLTIFKTRNLNGFTKFWPVLLRMLILTHFFDFISLISSLMQWVLHCWARMLKLSWCLPQLTYYLDSDILLKTSSSDWNRKIYDLITHLKFTVRYTARKLHCDQICSWYDVSLHTCRSPSGRNWASPPSQWGRCAQWSQASFEMQCLLPFPRIWSAPALRSPPTKWRPCPLGGSARAPLEPWASKHVDSDSSKRSWDR